MPPGSGAAPSGRDYEGFADPLGLGPSLGGRPGNVCGRERENAVRDGVFPARHYRVWLPRTPREEMGRIVTPTQLRNSLFGGTFFVAAIAWFALGHPTAVGLAMLLVAAVFGAMALIPPRR